MDIYHVNDKGVTGKCTATKRSCPLGGDERHFTTPEAANQYYEASMQAKTLTKTKRVVVDPILKKWGKIPDSNGESFTKAWNDKFKKLKDYEAIHGPVEDIPDISPKELLDQHIWFSRERNSEYLTVSEFYRADHDYSENIDYTGVVRTTAKIGGGNREDYEDEWDDASLHPTFITNDDYDVYGEFYFGVNKTPDEMRAHEQRIEDLNYARHLKELHKNVGEEKTTPWAATFVNNGTAESQLIKSVANNLFNAKRLSVELPAAKKKLDEMKELKVKVEAGAVTENEINNFNFRYPYEKDRALEALSHFTKSKKELANLEEAQATALELPEGNPLREWAVGDRGVGTYRTTEKQGRRKVEVIKTYQKGSLLGKEIEDSDRTVKSSLYNLKSKFSDLDASIKREENEVSTKETGLNSWLKDRETAWAAGWPGAMDDLPPMSKNFNAL